MHSRRTSTYLISAAIAFISVMLMAMNEKGHSHKRPNILMIMSDNQSWNHVGIYGDRIVKTPHFDQIATEGIRFTHAFCASPSCTPARAALLTGQDIWRLKEGANLWGTLPAQFKGYPDWLEESGYQVGYAGKGWGPGNFEAAGRVRNPAGNHYPDFKQFLADFKKSDKQSWSYWFSSKDPHRPYGTGTGMEAGIDPSDITVPSYLPDSPEVRGDIADYYAAIQRFDQQIGTLISELKAAGEYENTLIVICSDNGWQMPRGLGNLYDAGTRVPLIISWPGKIKAGRINDDLVSLNDLAPTFLEIAGIEKPRQMTAKSLLPVLQAAHNGIADAGRKYVVMGRERHAFVRSQGLGYPARAIRTRDYLYIVNHFPDRWPAGDPPLYGDVDAHMLHYPSPTKLYMLKNKDQADTQPLFDIAFSKRPAEELYHLKDDPDMLHNLSAQTAYQDIRKNLQQQLREYLIRTADPRATSRPADWDTYPYYQERDFKPKPSRESIELLNLKEEYNYLE